MDFAETRGKGIVISHTPKADLDVSLFAYKGEAKNASPGGHSIDWGMATEIAPLESLKLGAAYISDLADAQQIAITGNDPSVRRVGG